MRQGACSGTVVLHMQQQRLQHTTYYSENSYRASDMIEMQQAISNTLLLKHPMSQQTAVGAAERRLMLQPCCCSLLVQIQCSLATAR